MNIHWKTLVGTCIYQSPDGAQVHQNLFYRWLTVNSNLLQTLINRHQPHIPSLQYIKPFTFALRSSPASCCLLGLGGGAVAHAMSRILYGTSIVAVESNPHIIQIASRYFMTDHIKNLEIIHQDANIFVQTCKTKYQHLLIDIYQDDKFPLACNHTDFFYHCKRLLLPDGLLTINLASLDEAWRIIQYIWEHFNKKTVCIPIKGATNLIIVASQANSLLNLFEDNNQVKRIVWDAQWGYLVELN